MPKKTRKTTSKKTPATKPVAVADDANTSTKSIVPKNYKELYGKAGNCGDELAAALKEAVAHDAGKDGKTPKGIDEKKMAAVAKANSIDMGRWSGLNIGQQRMNLGNVLRNRLKRGEFVQVGDDKWNEGSVAEKKSA